MPVSLLGLFCICERTSHCTQNARWSLSLFLLCAATAVPATIPHGSAKMFLDCNTGTDMPLARHRRIRQNETDAAGTNTITRIKARQALPPHA